MIDLFRTKLSSVEDGNTQQDTAHRKILWEAQDEAVRGHFDSEATNIARAIRENRKEICFNFPDRLYIFDDSKNEWREERISRRYRQLHTARKLFSHSLEEILPRFIERLSELQSSQEQAVAYCAELLRYRTALALLESLPICTTSANDDALASSPEAKAPFPQWVAFNSAGQIVVGSIEEAEERIGAMEKYLQVLSAAFALDAGVAEEPAYQLRYHAILQQWTEQACAYAHYQTLELIRIIRNRAMENTLNRGLSLSLPYFDDQKLQIKSYDFEVIPAGRIAFEPVFVAQAAQEAKQNVANDIRLSVTTRERLIAELDLLEKSFSIGRHYMPIGMLFQPGDTLSDQKRDVRGKALR